MATKESSRETRGTTAHKRERKEEVAEGSGRKDKEVVKEKVMKKISRAVEKQQQRGETAEQQRRR